MSTEDAAKTGTVLIVDDAVEVRRFVGTALSNQGYQILQSCCGVDALLLAPKDGPIIDILVTDISLPDTDGITLAEHLLARFPGAGVVIMSGCAEVPRCRLQDLASRWAFVPKPFQMRRLVEAVGSVRTDAGARAA
jgi:two-component system cell cycle sensor histidine kinase/response regulator CckA